MFSILVFYAGITVLHAENSRTTCFRAMFYNVENLFDCEPDSIKNDKEFIPTAKRNWNSNKYNKKLSDIAHVIQSLGKEHQAAIIGLCEIENKNVLKDLTNQPTLKGYHFIHYESPDARGIDVALLYSPSMYHPVKTEAIPILFPHEHKTTRDILYVKGNVARTGDSLHIFICHFPSRSQGIKKTEPYRIQAAGILKEKTDSIFKLFPNTNILIMGDFNDYPTNHSISQILKAEKISPSPSTSTLYNLTYPLAEKGKGSYKHQGKWCMMDQIIVSGNLLNTGSTLYTTEKDIQIYNTSFLLETDNKYDGHKPFRTYYGIKYNGGYSDHLPVYTDFHCQ